VLKTRTWAPAMALISLITGAAHAQSSTASVPITKLRTGWAADQFAIETGQAVLNPANCPVPNGYHSAGADPGYKTYYTAALTALALGKNVTIVVSNTECSVSGPRIIGLYIEK
jgi:hypothetical protein